MPICEFRAARTPFSASATYFAQRGGDWEGLRAEQRAKHEQVRAEFEADGWTLGPMHYVEDEPNEYGQLAEWRSRIIAEPGG